MLKRVVLIFSGVSNQEATEIVVVVSLPMGSLPYKYLSVPLAARKLNYSQCKILVDKITTRAQAWMAQSLSYAGILQLIRSILCSM